MSEITLVVRIWRNIGNEVNAVYNGDGWENAFMTNTQTFRIVNVPEELYVNAVVTTALAEDIRYFADTVQGAALINLVDLSEQQLINMSSVGDIALSYTVGGMVHPSDWVIPFSQWEFGAFTTYVSHAFTRVWPLELEGQFSLLGDAPADNDDCLPFALVNCLGSLTLRTNYVNRKAPKLPFTVDSIREHIQKPSGCCSFDDLRPFLEAHRLGVVVYDIGARCRLNWKHLSTGRNGAATAYLLYHNRHVWPLFGNKRALVQAHLQAAVGYMENSEYPPRLPTVVQEGELSSMIPPLVKAVSSDSLAPAPMNFVYIHDLPELERAVITAANEGTKKLNVRSALTLPALFQNIRQQWSFEPSVDMSRGKLTGLRLHFQSSEAKDLNVYIDCCSADSLAGLGGQMSESDFQLVRGSIIGMLSPSLCSTFNAQTILPFTSQYANGQIRRCVLTEAEMLTLSADGGAFEIDRRRAFTADLAKTCTGDAAFPVFREDASWEEVSQLPVSSVRPKSLYLLDASKLEPFLGHANDTRALATVAFLFASKPYVAVWGFALLEAHKLGLLFEPAVFGVLHPSSVEPCNARKVLHQLYSNDALDDAARKLGVNIVIGMSGSISASSNTSYFTTDPVEAEDLCNAVRLGGGSASTIFSLQADLGGYLVSTQRPELPFSEGYNVLQSMVHGAARMGMIAGILQLPVGERDDWLAGVNADALLLRRDPAPLQWATTDRTGWHNLGGWAYKLGKRTLRFPGLSLPNLDDQPVQDLGDMGGLQLPPGLPYIASANEQPQHLPVFHNGVPISMPADADPWLLSGNVLVTGVSGSGKTFKCLGGAFTPFSNGLVVACPTHDRRLGIETEFQWKDGQGQLHPVETTTISCMLGKANKSTGSLYTRAPYHLLPHQSVVIEEAAWLQDEDLTSLFGVMDRNPTVKWVWNLDWLQNTLASAATPDREANFASRLASRFRYVLRLTVPLRLQLLGDQLLHDSLRERFSVCMSNLADDVPIDWPSLLSAFANVVHVRNTLDGVGAQTMITHQNLAAFVWNETRRGGYGAPISGERMVFRSKSQLSKGLVNHRAYEVLASFGHMGVKVRTEKGDFVVPRSSLRHCGAITGHLSQGSTYTFPYVVYAADLIPVWTAPREIGRETALLSFLYTALTRTVAFDRVTLYVGPSICTALAQALPSAQFKDAFKAGNGVCAVCAEALPCVHPHPMQFHAKGIAHASCL